MRMEERLSYITLPKAMWVSPRDLEELLHMICFWFSVFLVTLFALNGSICSSWRADVTEGLTGSKGPGGIGMPVGGTKGVESLCKCLSSLYIPKD